MMNYLQALKTIKEIESNYDILAIKFKSIPIWPYLRIYLFDSLLESHRAQGYTGSNIKRVLKSVLYYNPIPLFKHYKIWIIGDTADRKFIDGKYQQSITGAIPQICDDYIELERPYNNPVHYKRNLIKEKRVVSFSIVYLLSHVIEILLRINTPSIQNEEVLRKILRENDISFNYNYYIRYFYGQYLAMKLLCKISAAPRAAILICPYTIMGCVRALKEYGTHIIEMQHGVINKKHFAYTGTYRTDELFPDELCVFGDEEYQMFTSDDIPYCKNVHKTGLYILDESLRCFKDDIFKKYRTRFTQIVVLAGQVTTDNRFIPFFSNLANMLPEVLFVYIPRGVPDVQPIKEKENLIYRAGVNIYEYLKWCDVHCTVSSTTCLEAHYFRKPTIFYNLNQLAESYYSSLLNDRNGVYYIDTEESFIKALRDIQKNEVFEYKQLYAKDGYVELSNLLKKYAKH